MTLFKKDALAFLATFWGAQEGSSEDYQTYEQWLKGIFWIDPYKKIPQELVNRMLESELAR